VKASPADEAREVRHAKRREALPLEVLEEGLRWSESNAVFE
jgi:hypothetical protein